MKLKIFSALVTAVGLSSAQTPPGFTPNVTAHLDVIYGTTAVSTPGMSMTEAQVATMPTIGTNSPLNGTSYLFIMMDLDVPTNFANPKAGGRTTNLHAMLTGLTPSATANSDGVYVLTTTAKGPKAYIGPQPPKETPPFPHTYVQLLYDVGSNFSVPASQNSQIQTGLGFDLAKFATAASLEDPIAANYYNVTG